MSPLFLKISFLSVLLLQYCVSFGSTDPGLIPITNVEMVYDRNNEITFEEISGFDESKFTTYNRPYIVYEGAVWIKLDLIESLNLLSTYYLSLLGNANEVELYYLNNTGSWSRLKNGIDLRFTERSEYLQHPVFTINEIDPSNPVVYIRLLKPVVPLIALEKMDGAYEKEYTNSIFTSMVIGVLFFIVAINFYRGIVSKQNVFVLYSFYILGFLMAVLNFNYLNTVHFLFDISPYVKDRINGFSIPWMNIAGAWYGIVFLDLRKSNRILFYLLLILIVFSISFYFLFTYIPELSPLFGNIGLVLLILIFLLPDWKNG